MNVFIWVNVCVSVSVCVSSSCWSLNVNGAFQQLSSSEHSGLDQLVLVLLSHLCWNSSSRDFSAFMVPLERVYSEPVCVWKLLEQRFVLMHRNYLCHHA